VLKVAVADDSVLLREGLIRLLTENGHDVVAAVGDGPSLVRAVEVHRPDVSVVDVRMPPSHTDEGLRAAVEARRRVPRSPISSTPWTGWRPEVRCSIPTWLPNCCCGADGTTLALVRRFW